jgi:hypothetical protein
VVKPRKTWSIAAGVAGATESLARGLAVDLAPIRVNVISPGVVGLLLHVPFTLNRRDTCACIPATGQNRGTYYEGLSPSFKSHIIIASSGIASPTRKGRRSTQTQQSVYS